MDFIWVMLCAVESLAKLSSTHLTIYMACSIKGHNHFQKDSIAEQQAPVTSFLQMRIFSVAASNIPKRRTKDKSWCPHANTSFSCGEVKKCSPYYFFSCTHKCMLFQNPISSRQPCVMWARSILAHETHSCKNAHHSRSIWKQNWVLKKKIHVPTDRGESLWLLVYLWYNLLDELWQWSWIFWHLRFRYSGLVAFKVCLPSVNLSNRLAAFEMFKLVTASNL